jgi:hypothetical protein
MNKDYKKWVRYYLDYCGKYGLPIDGSKSLAQFLGKLKEKRQTELQVRQAGHAITLLHDLHTHSNQTPPSPRAVVIKPDYVKSLRQPSLFAQPALKEPKSEIAIPIHTGSSWEAAVNELVSIIKTNHYSPKTLKSYRHWVLKFKSYRGALAPADLVAEDVKAFLSHLAVTCHVSATSQNQAFNLTFRTKRNVSSKASNVFLIQHNLLKFIGFFWSDPDSTPGIDPD